MENGKQKAAVPSFVKATVFLFVIAGVIFCLTMAWSNFTKPSTKQQMADKVRLQPAPDEYETFPKNSHFTLPHDIDHVWVRVPYSQTIDEIFHRDATDGLVALPNHLRLSEQGKLQMKFVNPGQPEAWRDWKDTPTGFTMILYDNYKAYYIGDGIYYLRDDVFARVSYRRPQMHKGFLISYTKPKRVVPGMPEPEAPIVAFEQVPLVEEKAYVVWDSVDKCWRSPQTLAQMVEGWASKNGLSDKGPTPEQIKEAGPELPIDYLLARFELRQKEERQRNNKPAALLGNPSFFSSAAMASTMWLMLQSQRKSSVGIPAFNMDPFPIPAFRPKTVVGNPSFGARVSPIYEPWASRNVTPFLPVVK